MRGRRNHDTAERLPGERVGRYEILSHIASGGMGEVYLASLGEQRVAIKLCHPHLAEDPEFVAMFSDEARIASAVRHPNVVATLDVADDSDLYMVMEYVEGTTLAQMMRRDGGPVPIPNLLRVMRDALDGLHAAHELRDARGRLANVIHRDVTPQNILIGLDGRARLSDFGVAKAAERAAVTRDGSVKGKLGYIAPEQLRGAPIDRRVDIFTAGVVLWEGLAGQRAFRGASSSDTINKILTAPILAPSTFRAEVPPELDRIVLKAMTRDLDERFSTAAELAQALESCAPAATAETVGEWVRSARAWDAGAGEARTAVGPFDDATVVSDAADLAATEETSLPEAGVEETSTAVTIPTPLRMPQPDMEDPFASAPTVVQWPARTAEGHGPWLLVAILAAVLFTSFAAMAFVLWLLWTASSLGP